MYSRQRFFTVLLTLFTILFTFSCSTKEADPNPVSCKISQVINKHVTIDFIKEKADDTLKIDGQVIPLTTGLITTYKYDRQGRIIEERNSGLTSPTLYYGSTFYYVRDSLLTYYNTNTTSSFPSVYPLTNAGLLGAGSDYRFDSAGYVIQFGSYPKNTYTILDGNTVQSVYSGLEEHTQTTIVSRYEYDHTRPALPTIYQFQGKQSKNLVVKVTEETTKTNVVNGGKDVFVGTKSYQYVYDELGRVKRRITVLSAPYYGGGPICTFYVVDDYAYTCQ